MADWSGIPEELLSLICQRLDSFVDYLQFKVVCKSWRCVSYNYPVPQLPLLMLPQENTSSASRRSFLGLTRGGEELDKTKVYELDLPEIHQHRCVGAAGNWIVTVDMELDMHIFNLFSKVHMNLPSQSTFNTQIHDPTINQTQSRELMVSKVVLTYPKDPSEDFIAVAIHTVLKKIAIARPGDKTWTTIQNIPCVMDVIYFKQQLYGICANRKLYILDIKSDPPKASEVNVSYSLILHGYVFGVRSFQLQGVIYASQITGKPRLVEPIYLVEIQAPKQALERGSSLGEVQIQGTPLYKIQAYLPVIESFGFSSQLSAETSGHAFAECVFDHWEMLTSDPLEAGSVAATLVSEIHRRKGLKEQMTPRSEFEDKL
ncbi:hypothetical protein IFM89_039797 [Coptis chinensis]|uniref:Uncharacterized protein n=1 Tax=Coptis chinensis TaxID=261450 RepID=A0A835GSW8_9MAGN|nr:hypothetical protein IFM89_039797 [Coptis chinensis]